MPPYQAYQSHWETLRSSRRRPSQGALATRRYCPSIVEGVQESAFVLRQGSCQTRTLGRSVKVTDSNHRRNIKSALHPCEDG